MKKDLDISIVVLNYNTSDLLKGALESIVSTAGGINFEVVVIDNASTDGGFARLPEKLKKHDSRFSFIQNPKNVGWAAINIMLSHTRGRYIATIDPDAILHPETLQLLVKFMDNNPNAGAVTASLLNPDGSIQHYYRRTMTPLLYFFTTPLGRILDKYLLGLYYWKLYHYDDLDFTRASEVEQPAWPCLIWRREILGKYIVDENIPFYFVDVDMSKRLYDNGYKIYLVPEATITHLKSTSFGKRGDSWRQQEYYRSLLFYFRKHYPYHAPLMWVVLFFDRLLRALILYTTGREPLR